MFSREGRSSKPLRDPEIFFIGSIEGGLDFDTRDGLFCEMQIDMGDGWRLLRTKTMKSIVTQTCYADQDTMFVWDHPFELNFRLKSIETS